MVEALRIIQLQTGLDLVRCRNIYDRTNHSIQRSVSIIRKQAPFY